MTPDRDANASRLAALLLDARRNAPIAAAPDDAAPADETEAYRVQELVAQRCGRIAGYKVGSKTPDSMPLYAPLLAHLFYSPPEVPGTASRVWAIEGEIMFRLGRDLPPRGEDYGRGEVLGAIDQMLTGFEIIDSRFSAWPQVPPLLGLADQQSHGGMVCGPGQPFADRAFDQTRVRLTIDGRTIVEQAGGNSAGDPLRLLVWLANEMARKAGGLRAGDIVTTGSCTGVESLAPGATAELSFEGFEPVRLRRGA
jgi:2-keto-4-pentenoate hydratase